MNRLVLVTVGSDHHPFQRLVDFADRWAADHPEVRVVVQYGTARAPSVAEGRDYLAHADLQELMASADSVVTQGGPTGIAEARRHGRLPVVVPRQHGLGEHVDDHQRAFARFLAEAGTVRLAETEDALAAALDEPPAAQSVDPLSDAREVAASVARFGELVQDLAPRRRLTRAGRNA